MIRAALALLAGLLTWGVVATALDRVLRATIPGYAAAEPHLTFTMTMMVARLALPGAIPSLCAGFVATRIARGDRRVALAAALLLTGLFLPAHYALRNQLPAWYHLTFLVSLIVLPLVGAQAARAIGAKARPGSPAAMPDPGARP